LIAKSTERESMKLDYRETVEARKGHESVTEKQLRTYGIMGQRVVMVGKRVEKTEVKAKEGEEPVRNPY